MATPGAAAEMVRHEQRLLVSTSWAATETVRVRKKIITETRMVPVEVRVEVLEVDHLPLTRPTDGELSGSEALGTSQDFVVVLHEEVPVVTVQTRAVERATVSIRMVTSQVAVTERLNSEQVDVATDLVPQAP